MRRLFTDALRTAAPTIEKLAEEMGCSTAALRAYRLGTRTPAPPTTKALAVILRRQSKRLERYATQLEDAARQQGGTHA